MSAISYGEMAQRLAPLVAEILAKGNPVDDALEPMMQFFAYAHLPPHLQAISKPFGDLAQNMVDTLPRNPERSAGLRKLLEAKDCAVRAHLYK